MTEAVWPRVRQWVVGGREDQIWRGVDLTCFKITVAAPPPDAVGLVNVIWSSGNRDRALLFCGRPIREGAAFDLD
jgi:hypothetical protein